MTKSVPSTALPPAEAVDALDQGLLWLDGELRVAGHNAAYRRLLGIAEPGAFIGHPYAELLGHLLTRGEFFDADATSFLETRLNAMRRQESLRIERVRPDGTALSVMAAPLASGGYIYTYLDVTRERTARIAQQRHTKATVVAMANFAEHRDIDTGVHVLRVSRLVGQTARKLAAHGPHAGMIDEDGIEQLATAAILHDVGKIATPDGILLKTGPLSTEEREVMKRHAADGAHLLRQARLTMGQSPYLDLGVDIALTHHEWFDGNGYPAGQRGEDIPLAGRICAVADVFDALTSRRPYKAPWEVGAAIELLHRQSGTQFDPDVVAAFIEVLEERERVCLVRWQDNFSVGNLHIDEQHTILIDIINQLASAESLHNHHSVAMIIDELVSYAAFHFEFEERLMAKACYPELTEHCIIHQAFIRWATDLRDQYQTFGKRPLGEAVLTYLRDWLSHHILGEDQRYRPFVEKLG